jgi:hypothetical protein
MFMRDALVKIGMEIDELTSLAESLEKKGFTVSGASLTARKAELQFVYVHIVNCYHPKGKTFAEVWKFVKSVLAELESEQDAYVERNDDVSAWCNMKIKEHRRVLKVLETMFPEEVKAAEVPPTAAVAITPQAMDAWLQSKPSEETIMSVMSVMKSYSPTAYAKFITPDIKQAQIDLIEATRVFISKQ